MVVERDLVRQARLVVGLSRAAAGFCRDHALQPLHVCRPKGDS
jgi:hypothetical protein